ncbi:MAG: pyridoxamine kinase [Lachnospiraceae bacterium]|nr:pyridoxamine kinase [Lachnospiraceae bacterium]
MSHNNQKKIAIINDMSGFGRCSIAVELPIISMMKIQACPLPTSIFSNHTGFESFFFDDYTDKMEAYMEEWEKLGLAFDGICTGFLGSKRQIRIVEQFMERFKTDTNLTIIDPVMGDYGRLYSTYTPEICLEMKKLVHYADILTPNLTEACILADMEYKDVWTVAGLKRMAYTLSLQGPKKIVITGIAQGSYISNFCYEEGKPAYLLRNKRAGEQRSGTGDIFSAIIAADAVNGVEFRDSVRKASDFIKKCIVKSIEMDIPLTDGVCFEEVLYTLR